MAPDAHDVDVDHAGQRRARLQSALQALQAGQFEEAASLSAPLTSEPDVEARLLHGLALGGAGDADASARLLCDVARDKPDALHPCCDLSGLLARHGRGTEIEPVYRAALRLTPTEPRLLLAYGDYLTGQWRPEEAETLLRRGLRANPHATDLMNQLGIVLVSLGQTGEALTLFREVVARNPAHYVALANLGCALANEGGFEEALAFYHRAIQLKPNNARIRLNHSICLLKSGRMTQGWSEHEWRLALPGHSELPRPLLLPSLAPDTDLSGSTVLVTQEEGYGDTLMYLRYAPLLIERGARVLLWVPQALKRVAERAVPGATVLAGDVANPTFTWHCPFISLPRVFAGTAQPMGVASPYLRADPQRVREMAGHLPARGRLRVGLVWGGAPRPDDPVAHAIDRRRSIGLQALAPLARLDQVCFVSLQMGPYADELAAAPPGLVVHDPMGQVRDMDDTASLLMSLDLVVTVDTSVVHLAGALGRPTILLDRYDNCWRWLHGREDSDWYPSVRIIRQDAPGDWDGVVARLLPMIEAARTAQAADTG